MQTRSIGLPTTSRGLSTIRWSTDEDMKIILSWLEEENENGVNGNFLCNWSATKKCHEKGQLLVFVDGPSGVAVAYQCGDLVRPGLLQVRHNMRGKGVGRKLVDRRMEETEKEGDEPILFIECNPPTSIPFWDMEVELPLPDHLLGRLRIATLTKINDLVSDLKKVKDFRETLHNSPSCVLDVSSA